ncbi:MAG TPA: hypothetical protein VEZ47_08965 [Gemmatirosa sp.]|nr:hypothetical protein [Gemmatirosa sp.]
MRDPNPSTADLALAAERAAAESDYETQGGTSAAGASDATRPTGDAAHDTAHAAAHDAADAARPDHDARVDPHPRDVPGADDAGAQGRDRDHGGWGDRGLFGGRAGGTGL